VTDKRCGSRSPRSLLVLRNPPPSSRLGRSPQVQMRDWGIGVKSLVTRSEKCGFAMGSIVVADAVNRKIAEQGNAPTVARNESRHASPLLSPQSRGTDRTDDSGTEAQKEDPLLPYRIPPRLMGEVENVKWGVGGMGIDGEYDVAIEGKFEGLQESIAQSSIVTTRTDINCQNVQNLGVLWFSINRLYDVRECFFRRDRPW